MTLTCVYGIFIEVLPFCVSIDKHVVPAHACFIAREVQRQSFSPQHVLVSIWVVN